MRFTTLCQRDVLHRPHILVCSANFFFFVEKNNAIKAWNLHNDPDRTKITTMSTTMNMRSQWRAAATAPREALDRQTLHSWEVTGQWIRRCCSLEQCHGREALYHVSASFILPPCLPFKHAPCKIAHSEQPRLITAKLHHIILQSCALSEKCFSTVMTWATKCS
jgi:hypothetical protein